MGKKDRKPPVVNHIQEINLEIDYEKLAEAIVKAQDKSSENANKDTTYTSSAFSFFITTIFRSVSIIGWFLSFMIVFVIVYTIRDCVQSGGAYLAVNIFVILVEVVLGIVLFLFSFILWKSAKEIQFSKDRNYIISVFSGIVSFAALVVALIALFKGVG